MALRGFGTRAFTGSAQPVFGTTLSAAAKPSYDRFQGNTAASNQSYVVLSVTDATWFRQGDHVLVGTLSNFGFNPSQSPDGGTVTAVDFTNNKITVGGLTRSHASGEYVLLNVAVAQLSILAKSGNASSAYIGPDSSVSSTSDTLAYVLSTTGAYELGNSSSGNVWSLGQWIEGADTDSYIASINTI